MLQLPLGWVTVLARQCPRVLSGTLLPVLSPLIREAQERIQIPLTERARPPEHPNSEEVWGYRRSTLQIPRRLPEPRLRWLQCRMHRAICEISC